MSYAYDDYGSGNAIAEAERDEARTARRSLSEMQRAVACRHSAVRGRTCLDCGTDVD